MRSRSSTPWSFWAVQPPPAAQPQDIARLARPSSPNHALAAPAGFDPPPDIVTRRYALDPAYLLQAVQQVASRHPRTELVAAFGRECQAHYVVRSAVFGFPDTVLVQATHASAGGSGLVLWSRSLIGHYDFGANRSRLRAWLAALDALSTEADSTPCEI